MIRKCLVCNHELLRRHKKYCSQQCHGIADKIENNNQKEYLNSAQIRFDKYILKTDSCWLWQGGINEDGYGKFSFYRKTTGAHRGSYILQNRQIPSGLLGLLRTHSPKLVLHSQIILVFCMYKTLRMQL